MLTYPNIDPVALAIGPFKIHWYGLMYLLGFTAAYVLGTWRAKKVQWQFDPEEITDLLFYCAMGVIVGGRTGYMLIYAFPTLTQDPLSLFRIWDGGMSFHGGLIGVATAMWLYARKTKRTVLHLSDFLAPMVPIGLGAGRIGNFINGELYGRITDVPWAMVFPGAGPLPRHPSELYEFALEGVVLFVILWWYSSKPRPLGAVSGLFLLGYGIFRGFAEFFRAPDPQLSFIAFNWLTMGQLLSLPMIVGGAGLLWWSTACVRKGAMVTRS